MRLSRNMPIAALRRCRHLAASTPRREMSLAPSKPMRRWAALPSSALPALLPIRASPAISRRPHQDRKSRRRQWRSVGRARILSRGAHPARKDHRYRLSPSEMWLSDLAVTNDDIGNVLLSPGRAVGRHRRLQGKLRDQAGSSSRRRPEDAVQAARPDHRLRRARRRSAHQGQ